MKKEYIILGMAALAAWYFLFYKKSNAVETPPAEAETQTDAEAQDNPNAMRQVKVAVPYKVMG